MIEALKGHDEFEKVYTTVLCNAVHSSDAVLLDGLIVSNLLSNTVLAFS